MTLAAKLSQKFSTKIIEKDLTRSKYLSESLEDTVVLNDDISDESLLDNEGIEEVDYFCSVTNDDQMNILSAKLAKDLGARKSIAIINKLSYRKLVSKEIDVVVSPEDVTIGSILASVRTSDVVKVHSLGFGEAELLEIIIHGDNKTSKVVGKKISALELPSGCRIGAIYREGKIILLNEDLDIKSNDRLIIYLLHKKDFSKLAKLLQVSIGFF
jgi:trk system potassium uptake protein TrkA